MIQRDYTTHREKMERIKLALAVLMLLAVIAGWAVTLATEKPRKDYDIELPMANAHVSWMQTYREGAASNEANH
jgi:hypothetical protein